MLAHPEDEEALACTLAARHTAVGKSRLARLDEAYRLFASAAALPSQVGFQKAALLCMHRPHWVV